MFVWTMASVSPRQGMQEFYGGVALIPLGRARDVRSIVKMVSFNLSFFLSIRFFSFSFLKTLQVSWPG